MISEEKLKIMTQMAIYEKNEGKDDFEIGKYYKRDYLTFNYIKTWICATIAYIGLWCLIFSANMEILSWVISNANLVLLIIAFILLYVVFVLLYEVATYKIHSIRYNVAKKRLKGYSDKAAALKNIYDSE